ncbi:putative protein phosphatase 2C 3 [Auxenochlorella protothecoides]|uniref:protein-serine/threonine phosphatase n=1 Tax=Auxenochlorella protothecoides TaxID=3075 RepID=A0A087SBJ8_AUXPR|nr:putative protein phosphatase 2C 3 [Auxenochlorella protothecoides]KFM23102.1 putative protein phosphatase 2C 3 [Auxenochlorella protothecoides]
MGQCLSSSNAEPPQSHARTAKPATPPIPSDVVNRATYPETTSSTDQGLAQLIVQTAGWRSQTQDTVRTLVHQTREHLFLAVFQGIGLHAEAVVSFLHGRAYQVFTEQAGAATSLQDALRGTLLALEAALLTAPALPHALDLNRPMSSSQARLSSGASACLAVVDLPACSAHVCSVGDSRCLLARTAGNFNSVAPAGRFLGEEHALRNPEERAGLEGCMVCDGRTPGLHLTRALGFAGLKGPQGRLRCDPELCSVRLSPADSALVLAPAPFWDQVSPGAACLRHRFYDRHARLQQGADRARALAQAGAGAGAGGSGLDAAAPGRGADAFNAAAHLVLYAMARAGAEGGRDLGIADLARLPFGGGKDEEGGGGDLPAAESGAASPAPIAATGGQPAAASPAPCLTRESVAGNLGVACVTLRWHGQSVSEATRAAAVAVRRAAHETTLQRAARRRWDALRALVDFQRAQRRSVRAAWHDAARAIYARAAVRARAVQEELYVQRGVVVDVSPSLKVREPGTGREVPAEEVGIRATVNF